MAWKHTPFVGRSSDGVVAEFLWHHEWCRATKNKNGITGWATVQRSNSDKLPEGEPFRIHYCSHNPCMSDWKEPSKYGMYGPVTHFQPSEGLWSSGEAAAADSAGALTDATGALADAAVADTVGAPDEEAAPAVAEPAHPPVEVGVQTTEVAIQVPC